MKKFAAFPLLILSVVFLTTSASAQDAGSQARTDLIEKQVDKMIEKDPSTTGMVQATEKGRELWDAAMNKVYNQLMDALPAADKEHLKQAQRDWLAFRDSDLKLSYGVYGRMQGTMYRPMSVQAELEVVKTRTLQLRNYLELAQESKAD